MTFEELKKANAEIQTTDIKGKDYAEVNQRIKAFRMLFPDGFIKSEIVSIENGICVMKARVGYYVVQSDRLMEVIIGEGSAYEKEDSSFINKTSYIENCETSAVGRALGMAGIGMDAEIASVEEQQNAMLNQALNEKITETQVKSIRLTIKEHPEEYTESGICNHFKVEKLEDLTIANLQTFLKRVNADEDRRSKEDASKGSKKST